MFDTKERGTFRYREMSVAAALEMPEVTDDMDEKTKARTGHERIGHVLCNCLLDDSGGRLFASPQEALAGIPASKWQEAVEVFADIMRMSGMWTEPDEKNG